VTAGVSGFFATSGYSPQWHWANREKSGEIKAQPSRSDYPFTEVLAKPNVDRPSPSDLVPPLPIVAMPIIGWHPLDPTWLPECYTLQLDMGIQLGW
jgi:hypothetical protein